MLLLIEALLVFAAIYSLLAWRAGLGSLDSAAAAALISACCVLISGACGLYQPDHFVGIRALVIGTIAAGLMLSLAVVAFGTIYQPASVGVRQYVITIALLFAAAVVTTRLAFGAALRRGLLKRRLMIVRNSEDAALDAASLDRSVQLGGFEIVRTMTAADLRSIVEQPAKLRTERIWAVIGTAPATIPDDDRRALVDAGVRVFSEVDFIEEQLSRVDIARLPSDWLVSSNLSQERWASAKLRRAFDVVLCGSLLLFTLPLLLITAAAIKLDSPGPVFYRQQRVGRGGVVFNLMKFRSMRIDAEAGGAPIWASKHDTRITAVGRFIRLTRIDEVPQVLNVLRGDMAFVGPRPERPGFVEQLSLVIPHYDDRAVAKPGITGWAQVNFPYGASVEDARMKLAYDLYYVKRRSLFLDLLILVATVRVVLFQVGSR